MGFEGSGSTLTKEVCVTRTDAKMQGTSVEKVDIKEMLRLLEGGALRCAKML